MGDIVGDRLGIVIVCSFCKGTLSQFPPGVGVCAHSHIVKFCKGACGESIAVKSCKGTLSRIFPRVRVVGLVL